MKHSLLLSLLLVVPSVRADMTSVNPFGEGGKSAASSLQGIIDARGNTCVDIQNASNQCRDDYLWSAGGELSFSLLAEYAGYAPTNSFGIYNVLDPNQRTTVFAGSATAGNTASLVSPYTSFGFFLENTEKGFIWYSDSTLNAGGGKDHMVAYQGGGDTLSLGGNSGSFLWDPDGYVLGWEDLNVGDWDYNDMVVGVRNASTVPDTASTFSLFGLAAALIVFFRRRIA
jgi:hypothetical protein